jgi:cytochrome c2
MTIEAASQRLLRISQHVLATTLILLLPHFLTRSAWASLTTIERAPLVAPAVVSYLLAALLIWLRRRARGCVSPFGVVLLICASMLPALLFSIGFFGLIGSNLFEGSIPLTMKAVLAAVAVAATLACVVNLVDRPRWVVPLLALAVAGTAAAMVSSRWSSLRAKEGDGTPSVRVRYTESAYYVLRLTEFRYWVPTPRVPGGGITSFGKRKLLMTGDGDLFVLAEDLDRRTLDVRRLQSRVPVNASTLRRSVPDSVLTEYFRAADLITESRADGLRLYATHHYWNEESQCFVMRVSYSDWTSTQVADPVRAEVSWRTLFETAPCLRPRDVRESPYAGFMESGGELLPLDASHLLVTIGDQGFNGVRSDERLAQREDVPYGKTLIVDTRDGTSRPFTTGHRNPEGLTRAIDGTIYETEHGPQGGDELNVLVEGRNYGWPKVTYGTEYGLHRWSLNTRQGSHAGYEPPFFAWLPSIGISDVVQNRGPHFELWNEDLLVASLKGKSLWRVHIQEGRVGYVEPVPVRTKIRDIYQQPDGRLILWADRDLIFVETAVERDRGESRFEACSRCHTTDQELDRHGVGPNLFGILGRRVASAPGYEYSPAMQSQTGAWTRDRLDRFLQAPARAVPGTTMHMPGIDDAADRTQIVEFLASLRN